MLLSSELFECSQFMIKRSRRIQIVRLEIKKKKKKRQPVSVRRVDHRCWSRSKSSSILSRLAPQTKVWLLVSAYFQQGFGFLNKHSQAAKMNVDSIHDIPRAMCRSYFLNEFILILFVVHSIFFILKNLCCFFLILYLLNLTNLS